MHGFKAQQRAGGGGAAAAGGRADVEAGLEVERRYGRLYDEQLNPFKQFQVGGVAVGVRVVLCCSSSGKRL